MRPLALTASSVLSTAKGEVQNHTLFPRRRSRPDEPNPLVTYRAIRRKDLKLSLPQVRGDRVAVSLNGNPLENAFSSVKVRFAIQ